MHSVYAAGAMQFIVTLADALCWNLYFRFSNAGKAYKAAFIDCAIVILSLISVVGYVDDHRMALPILTATFLGMLYAVKTRDLASNESN